ncbi:hypothetical protein MNBD_CHLOROFLEXI01-4682 [hydrothermal vent metagenome]|uniref:Uncharacterized protein n=1 Tax=hydrothermal vent metagenome TaxID=652676 RepID=A0A3B0W5B0_9ZZZZ
MARRKRKSKKKKVKPARRLSLPQTGLKAFRQGNYDAALAAWEQVTHKSPRLEQAIAEAYFRRALREPQNKGQGLAKAVALQPKEARYLYHAGLAAYKKGDFAAATSCFEEVQTIDEAFAPRVALLLALARLRQGQETATSACDPGRRSVQAVWHKLSNHKKQQIQLAQAFLQGKYEADDTAEPLWQGLANFANGRFAAAQSHLIQATKDDVAAGISHYYLGMIAARNDDLAATAKQWAAAWQANFQPPALGDNLGEVYQRLAEERLAQQEYEMALRAATEANRYKKDNQLDQLIAYLQQKIAYDAASAGDWQQAQDYWQQAQVQGGSTFRLACNLALAQEREEAFDEAAALWREALRRRPRRADHPDAITDDQVARLWQRTAKAYQKAGAFEEAINVQKMAVKWQPDDLTLRMELAEGLLEDGRFQAAENELERILDRNQDHIPALLLMGEVMNASDSWWQSTRATRFWQRVLEIEPNNAMARQNLIDFYIEKGDSYRDWGGPMRSQAIDVYNKALTYDPENNVLKIKIGGCYLSSGDEKAGQTLFDEALAADPTDLDLYKEIIVNWLVVDAYETAEQVAQQAAQAVPNIGSSFYVSIATNFFYNNEPDGAQSWLDKAVSVATDDNIYLEIGQTLLLVPNSEELGRKYLYKALELGNDLGRVHMLLAIFSNKMRDMKVADKHWREARKFARRARDEELLEEIEEAKMIFDNPLAGLLTRMMGGDIDPGMLDLPHILGDLFDEDDDDD